jgi:multisubunit Na+/H+ antiporter MnhF subunit
VNAFTLAATVLLVGFVPIGIVCLREPELDGVVALELAGAVAALVFLCLGEGLHRSTYFTVPVVCAAVIWASGMIFVRFFARNDDEDG